MLIKIMYQNNKIETGRGFPGRYTYSFKQNKEIPTF